jgi:hypothetical protein
MHIPLRGHWSRGATQRPSCPGGTSFQGESAQLQDARIPRRKHVFAPGDKPSRAL